MIVVIDVDASKVIEAVRSTGVVITRPMIEYAHYLISNMKNIGTWQLSNTVYGMVGGTAGSHKWNWKDLRDVDAAFRLTYGGTVTHSANGMQGNGVNGFADTKLGVNSLDINNHSMWIYSGTQAITASVDMGVARQSPETALMVAINFQSTSASSSFAGNPSVPLTSSKTKGLFGVNRNSSSFYTIHQEDRIISTQNVTPISNPSNATIYICGRNNPTFGGVDFPSNKIFPFATIGAGLSNQQAIQQSQIVTNAQMILNRA